MLWRLIKTSGFSQAAFRSNKTGQVISTGPYHNLDLLPGGEEADLEEWEAGFTNTKGRFYNRQEAAHEIGLHGNLESEGYFGGQENPTLEAGRHKHWTDPRFAKADLDKGFIIPDQDLLNKYRHKVDIIAKKHGPLGKRLDAPKKHGGPGEIYALGKNKILKLSQPWVTEAGHFLKPGDLRGQAEIHLNKLAALKRAGLKSIVGIHDYGVLDLNHEHGPVYFEVLDRLKPHRFEDDTDLHDEAMADLEADLDEESHGSVEHQDSHIGNWMVDPKTKQHRFIDTEGLKIKNPGMYPELAHPKPLDYFKRAEHLFADLLKVDKELALHLKQIRQAAPEAAKAISKRLFVDSMVPGVGNKAAYEDFLQRPRGGVHVMVDGNDFGHINKQWGQSVGDEAIRSMGHALRTASRMHKGKLFRVGGDEFRAHFDTPAQAYNFSRTAREELDKLVPVKGVHRHSVSIGLGHSPEHAEQALIQAKGAKKANMYPPGQAQTHAHSLLSGAMGPVPIGGKMPPEGFDVPINKSDGENPL